MLHMLEDFTSLVMLVIVLFGIVAYFFGKGH